MCTGIAILLHLFLEHLLCQEEITIAGICIPILHYRLKMCKLVIV